MTTKLGRKVGFLGAGKMATALSGGLLKAGLVAAEDMIASDVYETALQEISRKNGVTVTQNNREVLAFADVVIVAVKPDMVVPVLTELREAMTEKHLMVSIAAGVPLKVIESVLKPGTRVVRVMPNTPCLVGASASAYARGASATPEDEKLVGRIFDAVGVSFALPEKLLDAVTGLSGSGPAYVFMMIEAMSDGGVFAGLPRPVATALAVQTVMGAAKMVLETGKHPGELKDAVTSPGGTTIEGVLALERGSFRGTVMAAVRAGAEKSAKLGEQALQNLGLKR